MEAGTVLFMVYYYLADIKISLFFHIYNPDSLQKLAIKSKTFLNKQPCWWQMPKCGVH